MGHANVDTTLNVYTQVLDGSLRAAADKVGSELFTIVHKMEETGAQIHRERANASERRERSKPTKRLARERVRGSAGRSPPVIIWRALRRSPPLPWSASSRGEAERFRAASVLTVTIDRPVSRCYLGIENVRLIVSAPTPVLLPATNTLNVIASVPLAVFPETFPLTPSAMATMFRIGALPLVSQELSVVATKANETARPVPAPGRPVVRPGGRRSWPKMGRRGSKVLPGGKTCPLH